MKFMSNLKNRLLALILGVGLTLPLSLNVYAGNNTIVTNAVCSITPADKGIDTMCDDINSALIDSGIMDSSKVFLLGDTRGSCTNVTVDLGWYKELNQKDKEEVMSITLNGIADYDGVSKTARNKLYMFIYEKDESTSALVRQLSEDVNADFAEAYTYFRPFSNGISTVLGFICLFIFTLLGVMIVIDLAYLNLPFMGDLLNKNEKQKPWLVSIEAWNAVKESENSMGRNFKPAVPIYFKYKVKQLVMLFICLLYLVSGKIYDLLANVMDYFTGILSLIK